MCITTARAELSKTKIGLIADYITRLHHLFYANNVQNLSDGPNCMILPIPGQIKKLHDTTPYNKFMDELDRAFPPRQMRSSDSRSLSASKSITIEQVGAYTVVRCESIDANAIQKALETLPENIQPKIGLPLLKWYEEFYGKGHQLILCCFNNKELKQAQPVYVEYVPINFSIGFFPGADSHDGNPPRMGKPVDRDHVLFFGTRANLSRAMARPVIFTENVNVPKVIQYSDWNRFTLNGDISSTYNCDWHLHIDPHDPGFQKLEEVYNSIAISV